MYDSEAPYSPGDPARILAKCRAHILPIFTGICLCCYLDRTNLAFASISLNKDLLFSAETYGLGAGLFYLGYSLLMVPSQLLLLQVGAPVFLGGSVMAWGIVATLLCILTSVPQFYLLRFLLGACESGAFPAMWWYLCQFFPADELTMPFSILEAAVAAANVLAAPLAAVLLTLDGMAGLRGWQILFIAEGAPTIALGMLTGLLLPSSPSKADWLNGSEKRWLATKVQSTRRVSQAGGAEAFADASLVWEALNSRKVWWVTATGFLKNIASAGILFWLPLFIGALLTGQHGLGHEQLNAVSVRSSSAGLHQHHHHHTAAWVAGERPLGLPQQQQQQEHATTKSPSHLPSTTASAGAAALEPANASAIAKVLGAAIAGGLQQPATRQLRGSGSSWTHQTVSDHQSDIQAEAMADTSNTQASSNTGSGAVQALQSATGSGWQEWWRLGMLGRHVLRSNNPEGKQAQAAGEGDADGSWETEEEQVASHTAIFLSCVPFAAAALFTLWLGHRSQRNNEKALHLAVPYFTAGMLLASLPRLASLSTVVAFVALVVIVACVQGPNSVVNSYIPVVAPRESVPVALALYNSVANLGGLVGPWLVGEVVTQTGSYADAMKAMGVCMAVAAGMALVTKGWPINGEHTKQQAGSSSAAAQGEGSVFTDDPLQKMLEEKLEY